MLGRGTTPVIILNIKNDDFDFDTISKCHVILENELGSNEKTYDNIRVDGENRRLLLELTQEDTFGFYSGNIKLQLRIKLRNGSVVHSKIIATSIENCLEEAIM